MPAVNGCMKILQMIAEKILKMLVDFFYFLFYTSNEF